MDVKNSNFTSNRAEFSVIYNDLNSKFTDSNFKNNTNYTIVAYKIALTNCSSLTKTINKWVILDDNLTESDFIRIKVNKISVTYKSGKKLKIKTINTKNNVVVANCKVKVVLKGSKKTYTKYLTTNKEGIASWDISKYNVGMYYLYVEASSSNPDLICIGEADVAYVSKAPTIVKAPKVKFKHKKSKYFKVKIRNKKTKKVVGKIKIKLKVYTGKKYKRYTIKTNKKGVAKFNTKNLNEESTRSLSIQQTGTTKFLKNHK